MTHTEDVGFERWAALLLLRNTGGSSMLNLFGRSHHWRVLLPFFHHGPLTMSELALNCGVPASAEYGLPRV
jgi:hypothetical protein